MLITKRSPFTGKQNTMDLPVTQAQLDELAAPTRVRLLQDILPGLPAAAREFLRTGYTPEDWDAFFGPDTTA